MLDSSYEAMTARCKLCTRYLLRSPERSWCTVKMKRKRTKPALTKEQQAAIDGWVYVSGPKTIRGWNSIWVEGAREGRGELEETAQRPYIPAPTVYVPRV